MENEEYPMKPIVSQKLDSPDCVSNAKPGIKLFDATLHIDKFQWQPMVIVREDQIILHCVLRFLCGSTILY